MVFFGGGVKTFFWPVTKFPDWDGAIQRMIRSAHASIHKFIQFLKKKQSLSENTLARIVAGEKAVNVAKYKKCQARLVELPKHCSSNNFLKLHESLSFSFEF